MWESVAGVQVLSAGADGLVKLWGVRTSECLATFDEHEAKVWAMHVAGRDDSTLVTGGADARVNVWRDCTAEDEANAAADRAESAVKGQALSNALQVRFTYLDCTSKGRKYTCSSGVRKQQGFLRPRCHHQCLVVQLYHSTSIQACMSASQLQASWHCAVMG